MAEDQTKITNKPTPTEPAKRPPGVGGTFDEDTRPTPESIENNRPAPAGPVTPESPIGHIEGDRLTY
jgi:hypothetical protein